MPNIEDAITYELKREIADRYFGFRKLIEEDKLSLAEQIRQHTLILEKRISFDLIRIYILLKDDELIKNFQTLAGIDGQLFYDPYLTESPTIRQRVFEKITFRGLTRKGRLKNAILDSYERLATNIGQYAESFEELVDDQETISEEIKLFYKKNDLSSILGFLRSLGEFNTRGPLQGGVEHNIGEKLEKKLHIQPPSPVEQFLPIISLPAPLLTIKKELKVIINKAYKKNKVTIHQHVTANSFFRKKSLIGKTQQ